MGVEARILPGLPIKMPHPLLTKEWACDSHWANHMLTEDRDRLRLLLDSQPLLPVLAWHARLQFYPSLIPPAPSHMVPFGH